MSKGEIVATALDKLCETKSITEKGFYVYQGLAKRGRKLLYIGTTVQVPKDRFRWHKYNGKDLRFEVIAICNDSDSMINLEFELIQKHKPPLNKIVKRKQNLNRKLTEEQLQARVGDKDWCQSCLRRRVSKGHSHCLWCEKGLNRD